jgi:hypothetical protein
MTWKIVVTMSGDEPTELEVEQVETKIAEILDSLGFDHDDVSVQ